MFGSMGTLVNPTYNGKTRKTMLEITFKKHLFEYFKKFLF